MAPPELMRAFLSQATASGAKSTALQPLAWLSGMLILGLALLPFRNAPDWLLILLAILLGLSVAIFLASYIYFALKNPDALRSERFTLSKMAIEKNLIGDDVAGLVELDDAAEPKITAIPHYKDEGVAR